MQDCLENGVRFDLCKIQKGTIATLQKLQSKLCRNLSNEHVSIDNGVFSIFQSLIVEIHMCKTRTHIIFCDQTGILLSICPGSLQGWLKDKYANDHPNITNLWWIGQNYVWEGRCSFGKPIPCIDARASTRILSLKYLSHQKKNYSQLLILIVRWLIMSGDTDTHTISKYVHTTTHCAYRKEPLWVL